MEIFYMVIPNETARSILENKWIFQAVLLAS